MIVLFKGFSSINNDEFANGEPSLEEVSPSLVPENMALFDSQPFSHEAGLLRNAPSFDVAEANRPVNDDDGVRLSPHADDTV